VSKQGYLPSAWVWVAIAISVIASLFVILREWNSHIRAIIVTLVGIVSMVILVKAGKSEGYVIAASGFSLVAGAITLIRGQLQEKKELAKVSRFAFKLMPMMVLAVGTFVVAIIVSGWNWWGHMIDLSLLPNNSVPTNTVDIVNDARFAADGLFAIALYYFLGIGLMVLEITQFRESNSKGENMDYHDIY